MEQKGQNGQEQILVGIDVGSTTTKVAVMEAATGKVLFSAKFAVRRPNDVFMERSREMAHRRPADPYQQ